MQQENSVYQVIKALGCRTSFGGDYRLVTEWQVIDTRDGFVMEVFSLKRDAVEWVKQAEAAAMQTA